MRGSKTGLGTNRRVQDPHAPPAIAGRRIASRHHAWRCRLTSVKTTSLELGFSTPGHPLSVALPELPDIVWNAKGLGSMPPKPETFLAFWHSVEWRESLALRECRHFWNRVVRSFSQKR
jgi:hypothetical protein